MIQRRFKDEVEVKFGKNIIDILLEYKRNNYSYFDVSKDVDFDVSTVKKWCYKYGIKLATTHEFSISKYSPLYQKKESDFMDNFRKNSLNKFNVLNRSWICVN
jgi:hypothetical protein